MLFWAYNYLAGDLELLWALASYQRSERTSSFFPLFFFFLVLRIQPYSALPLRQAGHCPGWDQTADPPTSASTWLLYQTYAPCLASPTCSILLDFPLLKCVTKMIFRRERKFKSLFLYEVCFSLFGDTSYSLSLSFSPCLSRLVSPFIKPRISCAY